MVRKLANAFYWINQISIIPTTGQSALNPTQADIFIFCSRIDVVVGTRRTWVASCRLVVSGGRGRVALWQKSCYLSKIHQSLVYSNISDLRWYCISSLCNQIAIKNCVLKNILRNFKRVKNCTTFQSSQPHYLVKTYDMNLLYKYKKSNSSLECLWVDLKSLMNNI